MSFTHFFLQGSKKSLIFIMEKKKEEKKNGVLLQKYGLPAQAVRAVMVYYRLHNGRLIANFPTFSKLWPNRKYII